MNYFAGIVRARFYCLLTILAIITLTPNLTFAEINEDATAIREHSFSKELFESGQLVDQADSRADFFAAVKYYEGRGVDMNLSEVFRLFKKSAEWGNVPAQYIVGYMYKKGEGVKKKYCKGCPMVQKSGRERLLECYVRPRLHV